LRPTTIGSVEHRLLYWKAALAMARDHPLAGVGLGSFSQRFPAVTAEMPRKVAALPSHRPHSVLLGLAAETGLVGLALFVAFFVRPVRVLLTRRDRASQLALAVLSAMLLHACLHNVWLQDLFWVVAALAVALAAACGPAAALSVPNESLSEGRRHASEIGQLPR
jgi:O-antigen ligase